MTDVVIKRLSELDRAHTPLLNDMLHIMRGDKDYHILYGDYVDAILPGLGVDEPKWNAGKLHNVPVVITNPKDKEYIVYNSASNNFINKQILYSDINYGTLGVVNGLEYLKVVSGNLVSSRILTTELQPSNVNAAGKYLRISADGKSVYEDALIQETTIATSDITNLNTSQSGIGQITSATLNRPSGSVGFAFVAKQPNGNSAAMITVDTNNGETKVRTHNGGVNQNSFTAYYDIYNSRTNPLSSEITSTSATSIANSLAVSILNQKIETIIANSGNISVLLNTHKSSGDHDARYYTKTYIDATFPNFTNVSNAAILTTGKLDNNRLNDTITSNTSGNAATATKLKTPISLNGSNFDGSGNITTEIWGTSRTLTVGSTSKSVNGGSNVGWTLAEIGAPSTTGAGASGDWGINITGNAATATYATNAATAATVNYANSSGYAASAGSAGTVTDGVYTVGDQTIGGAKTFSSDITVNSITVGRGNSSLTSNTAFGSSSLRYNTTGNDNTAIGANSLTANTTGFYNTAVGTDSLYNNTEGRFNTAIGYSSLKANTRGQYNTAIGGLSLNANTTGYANTAIGHSSLFKNTTAGGITAVGTDSLYNNTTGNSNTAVGYVSLYTNTTGARNTAVGRESIYSNTNGFNNTAVGYYSLRENTNGTNNVAIGDESLRRNTNGVSNTAVGSLSLSYNEGGAGNTAIGYASLSANTDGHNNTAIGYFSLGNSSSYDYCSGLGYNANVTGSNQVQLGGSGTTTYVYGTVQNRSDERDKADIRDTTLGLEFIKNIRPVDYKWDMREDYKPDMPVRFENETDAAFEIRMNEWREASKLDNVQRDGSKKRNRYHHGVIAQEVKKTIEDLGVDFGGFQHHAVSGGDDVMSIGYDEFIAPLIKAVQELAEEVERLKARKP